jgi:acetyl-CoA carboxylase biotin carboxyl carrier protein
VQDNLQLLDGLPFGEMHLRTASFSLWLRRTADGEWTQELQVTADANVRPSASPGALPGAGAVSGADEVAGGSAGGHDRPVPDGHRAVRAPLPGTFYRAPMPGAPPFVEPGSPVGPDTVVGIVETMKLMNSISAGVRGTVAEILVANAGFAERDTVLMLIREERGDRARRGGREGRGERGEPG